MIEHFPAPTADRIEPDTLLAEGVSFEDFLEFFGETQAEWVMGKVTAVSNNTRHQVILLFLSKLIDLFLGYKPLGRLLLAGVPMKLGSNKSAREPDLIFIAQDHLSRIQATYVDGPADLVVEIVSPESTERDRGTKLTEYEAASIPEYWLLDPLREDAVIYTLSLDGRYRPAPRDAQGRLVSFVLPGFVLDPVLLWQDPPPNGEALIALLHEMIANFS